MSDGSKWIAGCFGCGTRRRDGWERDGAAHEKTATLTGQSSRFGWKLHISVKIFAMIFQPFSSFFRAWKST